MVAAPQPAALTQLVECHSCKVDVAGSNPAGGSLERGHTMIQLPRLGGSRNSAAELIAGAPRDNTLLFSFEEVKSLSQGYVDELCKQLIDLKIDRVTFISPTESFMKYFMTAHYLRSAKFFVETRS